MDKIKFELAIKRFDEYNHQDPKIVADQHGEIPFNLLYGRRMSEKLDDFYPAASEHLKLATRCQHIGRWEIPRMDYPKDRTGYLKWRSQLKLHHAKIASGILQEVGYDDETIVKVKDLLMKKQLKQNPETQILEDVICLVFLEYYFDDFSEEHNEEKLVTILKKTIDKMSQSGVEEALKLPLSEKANSLIAQATAG